MFERRLTYFLLAHVRCDLILREIPTAKKEGKDRPKKKFQKGLVTFLQRVTHILCAQKQTLFAGGIKKTLKMDGTLSSFLSVFVLSISRFLSLLLFVLRLDFCMRSSIFEYIFPIRGVSFK